MIARLAAGREVRSDNSWLGMRAISVLLLEDSVTSEWRCNARIFLARLIRQPGQHTSSHGVSAIIAVRIVADVARALIRTRAANSNRSIVIRRAILTP